MRSWILGACIAPAVLLTTVTCSQHNGRSILEGTYLGQTPPGTTPEWFAPGIISFKGRYEGGATFSPDGRWLAFKLEDSRDPRLEEVWLSELRDGVWSEPYPAPFNSDSSDWDFSFARSSNVFYFTSSRPATIDGLAARPSNIWRTEPSEGGWTEPTLIDPPINLIERGSGYPSLTESGTMYFHGTRDGGMGAIDILRARLTDGAYLEVENLGAPVNTEHRELDPCIAPDESYLLFISNRPTEAEFSHQLFITFRLADGSWSHPAGLGDLLGDARLPNITADGRYFFYTRVSPEDPNEQDIYWVSTKLFDQFLP